MFFADGITGHVLLGISAASVVLMAAAAAAAATRFRRERSQSPLGKKPVPRLVRRDSGLVVKLESFSEYVGERSTDPAGLPIYFRNPVQINRRPWGSDPATPR